MTDIGKKWLKNSSDWHDVIRVIKIWNVFLFPLAGYMYLVETARSVPAGSPSGQDWRAATSTPTCMRATSPMDRPPQAARNASRPCDPNRLHPSRREARGGEGGEGCLHVAVSHGEEAEADNCGMLRRYTHNSGSPFTFHRVMLSRASSSLDFVKFWY